MATVYKCPSCRGDVTAAVEEAFGEERTSIRMATPDEPLSMNIDEVEIECPICGTEAGYKRPLFGEPGS